MRLGRASGGDRSQPGLGPGTLAQDGREPAGLEAKASLRKTGWVPPRGPQRRLGSKDRATWHRRVRPGSGDTLKEAVRALRPGAVWLPGGGSSQEPRRELGTGQR